MDKKTVGIKDNQTKVELLEIEGENIISLSGQWTVYTLELGRKLLNELEQSAGSKHVSYINLEKVSRIDTSGALLINNVIEKYPPDKRPQLQSNNQDFQAILDLSHRSMRPKAPRTDQHNVCVRVCNSVGEKVLEELSLVVDITSFIGEMLTRFFYSLRHPKVLNIAALVNQIEQTGIRAVPIVALLNFLIGLVIAYMAAAQLVIFGAQIFVVDLLSVGVLREMGVLITAIMVAGRSGSAFTAQIGAMVTNEEVRAMQCMGMDPMIYLVLPRIMALVLVMPFLVIVANIMALLGGMFAMWLSMDISPTVFINTLQDNISLRHLSVGLAKTPFFAVVISSVGCFLGFKATGSTDSIGTLTTRSVVESIFLIITLDALFALLLTTIGI